jgi:hypothetical protein
VWAYAELSLANGTYIVTTRGYKPLSTLTLLAAAAGEGDATSPTEIYAVSNGVASYSNTFFAQGGFTVINNSLGKIRFFTQQFGTGLTTDPVTIVYRLIKIV